MNLTEYHYVYYSYEEYGNGYIGSRTCKCLPEEDVKYFGSYTDKNFKPTQKIILKSDYATREDAYADEIILQEYYKVVENPHFTNKAYQTSTKFCYIPSKEEAQEKAKRNYELGIGIASLTAEQRSEIGRKTGFKTKQDKTGIFALTQEDRSKMGKRNASKNKENGVGIFALTKEQLSETAKKTYNEGKGCCVLSKEERIERGRKNYEMKVGIHGLSSEEIIKNAKKGGNITKELGIGVHSLTTEERSKTMTKTNKQKWMCLETGYVTNSGALTKYQRKRGIDISKRKRVE